MTGLRELPLAALHRRLGARMGPFAGWEMPIHYPAGVLREHLHVRAGAGLFDVSHMGQVILRAPSGRLADAAAALERLGPADILGLAPGRQRYALFTTATGGILDDLMVAARDDHLLLVVNAARAADDIAHLRAGLPDVAVGPVADRALLALQGPGAEAALAGLVPGAAAMRFMDAAVLGWRGVALWLARSGYTGEDGFEISLPAAAAEDFARALLDRPGVAPAGLGARDSLRLEAGLPLCGQDLDGRTTPAMAGLSWAIHRARRRGGAREGGFPGAGRILDELAAGPRAVRVGLRPEGRAPMRGGTVLWDAPEGGRVLGRVTSGGFGPSVEGPIAMGYVPAGTAGTVWGEVRGRRLPATIVPLPFHPTSYKR